MPAASVKKQFDRALARPVIWSIATALILRLSLLVYLSITGNLSNLGDQADYLRVLTARIQTPSSEWDERTYQLWDSIKSFLIPTKFLFEIFGIHPFLPKILTILCSSLVAGVVAFLVIKLTNNRLIALSAGLIIALDPSAILWSTLIMRDSFVWIALASTALILHHSHAREHISKFSFNPFLLIFVIVFVRYLRPHTMAVLCIAIILAELCSIKKFSINTVLITGIRSE
jgi:4-amino-4-deoxy-L-arabinose transferase-like glycosyltransferase